MPTIIHTKQLTGNTISTLFVWSGLANGDDGEAITFSNYADRSVQVTGAFGVGGKVAIQGSNDGVNWNTLTGLTSHDLEFSTSGISMISEISQYIRPVVTAGDGTTNVTITILAKGY